MFSGRKELTVDDLWGEMLLTSCVCVTNEVSSFLLRLHRGEERWGGGVSSLICQGCDVTVSRTQVCVDEWTCV